MRHQKHYDCDNCHDEVDKLYRIEGMSDCEQNEVFNIILLEAWDFQRQCVVEKFIRRMREEKICPMCNNKENRKDDKMSELKKCPFCGGEAETGEEHTDNSGMEQVIKQCNERV